MNLYPFQETVYELLTDGRSVILQAPTGAGKTHAALYPFFRAWDATDNREPGSDFPRKCIYSVPLRVLANQFLDEVQAHARDLGRRRPLEVTIQTGARPEDPRLEGNLVFTTIDQTLSNFLNIPYALSRGQGNLNSGAVLSSYLVFDEVHLFDPETMLPTTLHLLRLLRGLMPFLVMTATLSSERIHALARELDAEPVVLSPQEAAALPSQKKTRRIHRVEAELSAEAVLEKHRARSIAICNTVGRAQALFEALQRARPEAEIRLLHSRFLRQDRDAAEEWLRREFGKDDKSHGVGSAILVATQVVEVGLDITSQALHTELAPAASVVQRAGRCARYEGEEGDVYVYRLLEDHRGQPKYAPYTKVQGTVCERTWHALAASPTTGQAFDFGAELALVNQAHHEADQQLLAGLRANRFYIADRIAQTLEAQERGAARELIRAVDSRTILVHPEPEAIEHPWAHEGFGVFRGSLFGAYQGLEELADELGEEWVMMTADPLPEEESARERTVWRWRHILARVDLEGALIVAVNPRLASYSAEAGFRLGVPGAPGWRSPLRDGAGTPRPWTPYRRESYQEHVERMLQVYEHPSFDREADRARPALAEEMACAFQRLEQKNGWAAGTLDRLARLVLALHDLGKLDGRWQTWAHRWQEEVSLLRGEDLGLPGDYLAAHTDYDEQDEGERALNRRLGRKKPNHSAEGAAAAMDWLLDRCGDQSLARAALTAMVRHHSAGASGRYGSFVAGPGASAAVREGLDSAGVDAGDLSTIQWTLAEGELGGRLIRPRREKELLPYLLLVRVLRLADRRSQGT
jgi:CRISPR-associated endonuclease/helicase Cas3